MERLERRPRSRWWSAAPALVALGAAAALLVLRTPALSYTATATATSSGVVEAVASAPAQIRFSDGTQVTLEARSRGRVRSTSARGAHIALERGRARVHVVPRPRGTWQFEAGPCLIEVKGTSFDMSWDEPSQRLSVSLFSGAVLVRSPVAPAGIALAAGQRLTVDLQRHSTRIEPLNAPVQPAVVVLPVPPADTNAEPAAPLAPPPERPRVREPAPSWSDRVASGDFARVLDEARRAGVQQLTRRAGVADMMALADAARFAGDGETARQALLAVRARFAGSSAAHKAAYLLGRMAEDNEKDLAKALAWYEVYLSAAPRGPHHGDALGRKMAATAKLFGGPAARPLAETYLRRYPSGAYARAAAALAQSP